MQNEVGVDAVVNKGCTPAGRLMTQQHNGETHFDQSDALPSPKVSARIHRESNPPDKRSQIAVCTASLIVE